MKVFFVGAGPGDPELLTVKAARLLTSCRICIYAGSLVSPGVMDIVSGKAERYDSAAMSLEEIIRVCRDAQERNIDVVRLHSGDPSIYGAIREQMNELDRLGYFEYANELMKFMDKFIRIFTVDDLRNMQDNIENIAGIIRNLTQPGLLTSFNRASKAIAEVNTDDNLDNKSLFGLLKQLNSPGIRKSLSYSLRLMQAINQANTQR